MTDWHLKTPVALLIFKRPSTTEKVFEAIRQAKPPKLLVVANSARADQPGEAEKCAAARAIIERVDWDCEVLTNYADTFLSCRQRIYTGLDWVFKTVERAIIFEDDCVPQPTFFRFCEELLDYYQDDPRVTTITGDNFQKSQRTEDSYYFSRYTHFWGWATWRRAWQYYDVEMKLWPTIRDSGWLSDLLKDSATVQYWQKVFQDTYDNRLDTWDYQWLFASWLQRGLTVVPNVNLVSNIGFGLDSTHTRDSYDWRADLAATATQFPLLHPEFMIRDAKADSFTQQNYYQGAINQGLGYRVAREVRRARKVLANKLS